MKTVLFVTLTSAAALVSGCSSAVNTYDHEGNLLKSEKITNFSRIMDGTNSKSQIVMIDGTMLTFEASASAGENCTPGVKIRYANGKTALINARDKADFTGCPETVDRFFSGNISVGKDGLTSTK